MGTGRGELSFICVLWMDGTLVTPDFVFVKKSQGVPDQGFQEYLQ